MERRPSKFVMIWYSLRICQNEDLHGLINSDSCILCRYISCMESPTDRTETHAVVDGNIQAPSEVFSFSHGVLTM